MVTRGWGSSPAGSFPHARAAVKDFEGRGEWADFSEIGYGYLTDVARG